MSYVIFIAWRYASDDAWSIVPEMLSDTMSKFPIYFNGEKIPPNRESVKKILFSAKWCINQSRTKVSSVHLRHVSHAWPCSVCNVNYMGKELRHILVSFPCNRGKLLGISFLILSCNWDRHFAANKLMGCCVFLRLIFLRVKMLVLFTF